VKSATYACLGISLALASIAPGAPLQAQSYPNRVVRIVVPQPPGGGVDTVGRILAPRLADSLGQSFIVENRSGAAGVIGSASVARAAPDGYTLLVNATVLIMGPLVSKDVPYDPLTDFAPITQTDSNPMVLVTAANSPANNVSDLIALAKARPGQLSIANPGAGSSMDFAQAMFRLAAAVQVLTPVYKGNSSVMVDVMSGQVNATFTSIPTSIALVQGGRLKILAVTSRVRTPLLPQVPTVAESGLPDFESVGWHGMWAPAKTPRDIVGRLQAALARIVRSPEVGQLFAAQGLEPASSTPEQFAEYIRREYDRHARLIRDAGLKFD
jgi:tripartite-type tricarboxylate transporter receptor subunit TctC